MIASRIGRLGFSPTLAVADLAARLRAQGRDILDFSAGQPDFPTPEPVKEAAHRAIEANRTRYTPTAGIPELRQAIAARLAADRGLSYAPEAVLVSPGAKASLYFAFMALCEPGDEVIVPVPFWTSYPEQIRLAGAEPVFVDCPASQGFKLDPERLEAACTPRSRILVLNDPSNPTGAGYSRDELLGLAEVSVRRGLWVLADEIYARLVYDGHRHTSIASLAPEVRERTLVIDGVSKTYAMTGWRIGYAAGPLEAIEAMAKLQSHSTSNATSIAQWASVAALTLDDAVLEPRRRAFEQRRDEIVAGLAALDGVSCVKPSGAFYVFPDVADRFGVHGVDSGQAMARWLLERAGVAVVPGEAFGAARHVRLSYACSIEQVREGLSRIARALEELSD